MVVWTAQFGSFPLPKNPICATSTCGSGAYPIVFKVAAVQTVMLHFNQHLSLIWDIHHDSAGVEARFCKSRSKESMKIIVMKLWDKFIKLRLLTSISHHSWFFLHIQRDFFTEFAVNAPQKAISSSCALIFLGFPYFMILWLYCWLQLPPTLILIYRQQHPLLLLYTVRCYLTSTFFFCAHEPYTLKSNYVILFVLKFLFITCLKSLM